MRSGSQGKKNIPASQSQEFNILFTCQRDCCGRVTDVTLSSCRCHVRVHYVIRQGTATYKIRTHSMWMTSFRERSTQSAHNPNTPSEDVLLQTW